MMFYAQPYDTDANGFYFENREEYNEKAQKNYNSFGQKVEEYEIQFIDGNDDQDALFALISLNQFNVFRVVDWVNELESEDIHVIAGASFMLWNGEGVRDVMSKDTDELSSVVLKRFNNYVPEHKALAEYAEEFMEDTCGLEGVPIHIRPYIDFESMGRDWQLNGGIRVYEFAGDTYIANCQY